ncbi:2OG-Fe(II) oxygenase [Simiduia agarivorans]|uniref:2OG-Fe(II) oxygenase n=1 Tax=Simiduia agarivorans (strain DSM 21679 / JCM 13881 / BCRC 17597 / SA1) TaxID=1117647 RepID=K4KNB9_SIMAS|nr:2OG-Fe(II) oxygenase [Simiduia agarivorans]AFV00542.1 2OG-Fe(II) oxygenase [Simiduia agarivorans SA1 = DSM 21679]
MQHFIAQFDGVLNTDQCNSLIARFQQDTARTPGRTGAGVDIAKKDSTDLYLSGLPHWADVCADLNQLLLRAVMQYARAFPHLLVGALSPKVLNAAGQPEDLRPDQIPALPDAALAGIVQSMYAFDDINLQSYRAGTGGYHHWHSEHYPHPTDASQRSLRRVLLWLLYLNDVDNGGETEFLYQGAKVSPKAGRLVLAPCGFTHTHRGCVPVSNDKYVLASWVMFKEAKALYGQ